jgi:hypothetical protein
LSQHERVKRAYLQKKGLLQPQPQPQPQPTPNIDDLLFLMAEEQKELKTRKARHGIRKIIQLLRKTEV